MPKLPKPIYTVIMSGKDVTKDISADLISVSYTDAAKGESDTLSITLADPDQKYQSEWWPDKGTTLRLQIGYEGVVLDCGVFKVDEIVIAGPPDVMEIKGIATPFKSNLRSRKSYAHEDKSIAEIVNTVAQANGLTVENGGDTSAQKIKIARTTQNNESDLKFLSRLADLYGYYFSVRGDVLTFVPESVLDGEKPALEIDRRDLKSYRFMESSAGTFKSAKVSYRNPVNNENILSEINWSDLVAEKSGGIINGITSFFTGDGNESVNEATQSSPYLDNLVNGGQVPESELQETADDVMNIIVKAENTQQAERIAASKLYSKNKNQTTATITTIGNPLLVAGNTFMLSGMGKFSGKYSISKSTHKMDRSGGYECDCDIKRVFTTVSGRTKTVKKPAKTATGKYSPPVTSEIEGFNRRPGFLG